MMNFSNLRTVNTVATPVAEPQMQREVEVQDPRFFKDWNDPQWKVQNITLDQLKSSRKTLVKGRPLNDIEHYNLIEGLIDTAHQHGIDASIIDMFAANQGSQDQPGIEQDQDAVKKYTAIYKASFQATGMAPEAAQKAAHVKAITRVDLTTVRRVYCTLRLVGDNLENENCWTNLAVSYTPTNIQIGVGQLVKICHNQTILSSKNFAYTSSRLSRGDSKAVNGFQGIFQKASEWMDEIHGIVGADRENIERMMNIHLSRMETEAIIGRLCEFRVYHDSSSRALKNADFRIPEYPLDNGQINRFVERVSIKRELKNGDLTLWDVYNAITEEHKPAYWSETGVKTKRMELHPMDFTKVLPQNMALLTTMQSFDLLPANI